MFSRLLVFVAIMLLVLTAVNRMACFAKGLKDGVSDALDIAYHEPTYRERLLWSLAEVWQGDKGPIVMIAVAIETNDVSVSIEQSTGDPELDNRALEAVRKAQIPTVPGWVKNWPNKSGPTITFHVDMSKLHTSNIKDAIVRSKPNKN